GVLFCAAGADDGPGAVRTQSEEGRGRSCGCARPDCRAGGACVPRHRAEARDDRAVACHVSAVEAGAGDLPERQAAAREPRLTVCGIAGIVRRDGPPPSVSALQRMAASLYHRGPDGYGLFTGSRVGLAHARLSIIDLESGAQPLTNEDGSIIVVFNGEIYNYFELTSGLKSLGHVFPTQSDTEVLVHGWEQWGPAMLDRLNGQWAFALYDRRDGSVFMSRDRFGIQPPFYTMKNGDLIFGSEVKALLASGEVEARLDPHGLDEVFTFWGARAPRTVFEGVAQLEPGSCALWRDGELQLRYYYDLQYEASKREP